MNPVHSPLVTRFAPSPTGALHLGHAVAAIVAHDLARESGGRFLLRIDDIDAGRCRPEFEAMILEDLGWLGLPWQGGIRRQSACAAQYAAGLARLEALGLNYPCFCTRKDILREAARAQAAPHGEEGPRYPGTCRALPAPDVQRRLNAGAGYVLRLDCARALALIDAPLTFEEHGAGPDGESGGISARPEKLGDIVLARAGNGGVMAHSYHLAVVIDDAAQGINRVTRGRDLFHATHTQRLLQVLLGLPAPEYLHHALAVDAAGKRLAKRHDALSLQRLREQGITPDQVLAMARQVLV